MKKIMFLCALFWAMPGAAHVTIDPPQAQANGYLRAALRVPHGCGQQATIRVTVSLPEGTTTARPMPKAGWRLEVTRDKLAKPYTSHGRTITEDVTRISWTAKTADDMLPNGHYDEFVLVGTLPAQAGVMYWPVQQLCEQGRMDWTEVPKPGQKLSDLKSPAAMLEVMPSAGAAAHAH
jgi:uncharacterized protein YcnI